MAEFGYFVRRMLAFGVDWYIRSVLINMLANGLEKVTGNIYIGLVLSCLIISFIYYVLIPFKVWKGQTLMLRAMQLKAVDYDNNDVSFKSLFIRYFVGCFILEGAFYIASTDIRSVLALTVLKDIPVLSQAINIVILAISILSIVVSLFDRNDHRLIHDYLARTRVIDNAHYYVKNGKKYYQERI